MLTREVDEDRMVIRLTLDGEARTKDEDLVVEAPFHYRVCPACDGTGERDESECATCGGRRVTPKVQFDQMSDEEADRFRAIHESFSPAT